MIETKRLILRPFIESDASQKLCEKLGMRREGMFMEFVSFFKYFNFKKK